MRRYTVEIDGTPFTIDVEETAADRFTVMVGDQVFEATLASDQDLPGADIAPGMRVTDDPEAGVSVPRPFPAPRPSATSGPAVPPRTHTGTPGVGGGRGDVLAAPMPGVILEVHVRVGDVLGRGDPVLVLEAMKMRNTVRAPRPGVVTSVEVEPGQPVGPGDPLVRLGAVAQT